MRIFLTGATGFIGSHVARKLLQTKCDVLALVRPGSDDRRIRDIRADLDLVEGTLEDCSVLQEPIARFSPDICIHLAWQSPGKSHNDENDSKCLSGSLRLLELLGSMGCPHFVTAGTYIEYCSSNGPVSEDSPTCPATFYAKSKYNLETSAQRIQEDAGRTFCSLRLFNLYGPGDNDWRLIPSIISSISKGKRKELWHNGQLIRDYSHVEDVANAICLAAKARLKGIVNVGSSVATVSADIARLVADLMGHPELLKLGEQPPPAHEPACLVANTTRLRRETGWSPKIDLRVGLKQTVQWRPE